MAKKKNKKSDKAPKKNKKRPAKKGKKSKKIDGYDFVGTILCFQPAGPPVTMGPYTGYGATCEDAREDSGIDHALQHCRNDGGFPVETSTCKPAIRKKKK